MKAKYIQILILLSFYIFSCTTFDLPEKCNDPIPTGFLLKGSTFPTEIVLSKNDVNPLVVTVEGNYTANWTITGAGANIVHAGVGQSAPLLKTFPNGTYVVKATGKNSCGFNFTIEKSIKFCIDSSPAEIKIAVNADRTATCTLVGGSQKVDWTLVDKALGNSILVATETETATIDPIKYPSGNYTLKATGKSECNIDFTLTTDYSNDYFDIFAVGESRGVKVNDIETDLIGNIYVTGSFKGVWVTTKGTLTTRDAESDFFVAKYTKFGVLEWIRTVESSGSDESNTIAVEPNGDFYISGTMDYVGIFGGFKRVPSGLSSGMFMAKYNTNGIIQWVNEGSHGAIPKELVISNNGIIYLLGDHIGDQSAYFNRTDIPNLAAEVKPSEKTFVIRYSSTGKLTNVIRPEISYAGSITADLNENIYVGGTIGDIFKSIRICKYNSTGTLLWTQADENNKAEVYTVASISSDKNNNIYISAYFTHLVSRSPFVVRIGSVSITGPASYIAKYNDAGEVQWVQTLDKGHTSSHKTDAEGNTFIGGYFQNFYELGTFKKQSNGLNDAFIAKISNDGSILQLETLGGLNNDYAQYITLDKGKNVYISGSFLGTLNYKDKKLNQIGTDPDSFILRLDK